jgi:hypothetical protein
MDALFLWFQSLTMVGKILTVLVGVPLGFTLAGAFFIHMNNGAGSSFWGEMPTCWTYLFRTMFVGFVGTLLLTAIFGSNYLLSQKLLSWGLGGWSYPVAFVLCLVSVLGLVLYGAMKHSERT